jgi:hypothetical protein
MLAVGVGGIELRKTPEELARGNRAAGPQGHRPALALPRLRATVIFHMLHVPIWANRLVVMIMAPGLPGAVMLAWLCEITPERSKPTIELAHGQSIRKLTGRRLAMAIIAVLMPRQGTI